MTSTHFIEKCFHGTVGGQCRCPSPQKTVKTIPCPDNCPLKEQPVNEDMPVGTVVDEAPADDSPRSKETESLSTTIPGDLADLVKQRAEEEDRTQSAIIKRALKAYMKGWTPGQGD